ncbi:hypothetical protein EKO23_10130 [Nocardioides guangzhouensis]|uniref:Uncharacterized protein n=1 Tax=Nocardioides guangzhouensis TaxID=2497878 RepID=A0A4V1XZC8_9ACTN|nr:hypothetical protein [Nocardioides guangzhouensis]RYP86299.1 hypothetical protein EKO23_10130 [Nocardioides guangzhouensis]
MPGQRWGRLAEGEATGHLLIIEGLTSYPSAKRLRVEARDCEVAYRNARYDGLDLQVMWRPQPPLRGDRVFGSCWASRPDGTDLSPLS